MTSIYLDYNATTPVDDRVLEAMMPWFKDRFWNAASAHAAGEAARRAVEAARAQVAGLINARPREVVFTSGATEANNLALKGTCASRPSGRDTLLVSAIEHKAVLDTAEWLAGQGMRVEVVPVRQDGVIDLIALERSMGAHVLLVSVMLANNETGAVQPLREISRLAHECGAIVHTDATQAAGKVNVDVDALDVDLLSLSAHKFYGPKGVGALYVRRGVQVEAQQHGGGHEAGLRSGTLNVPGAVGLGAAASLRAGVIDDDATRAARLVAELVAGLQELVPGTAVVGGPAERLPNTACLHFPGADAEAVMANARNVFVSSGSACTARIPEPSHVLVAMGLTAEEAYECIRFSVGRDTSREEVAVAVRDIARAVGRVRSLMSDEGAVDVVEGIVR